MLMLAVPAAAQEYINGVFYVLDDHDMTAEVTENPDIFYSGVIDIPEKVQFGGSEYTVTSVGDFAFYDCSALGAVSLPESVTSIGMYAFENCTSLKEMALPSGLLSIGEHAFGECHALQSLSIPDAVVSIGEGALEGCEGLGGVSLGRGMSLIPGSMFARCVSLASVSIPENIKSIDAWAFSNCTALGSVSFEEGVDSIGECAFAFCYALESIELPESLHKIGANAFAHCLVLGNITLPSELTEIGDYIFDNCEMLGCITTRAEVPVKVVNDKLIDYRDQTVLYVPSGSADAYRNTEAWGGFADYRDIVEGVKPDYCLKRIENDGLFFIVGGVGSDIAKVVSKKDGRYSGEIRIPTKFTGDDGTEYTVEHIGEGAFELCVDMTRVDIPFGITSIGEWAFSGCQTLPEIDIPFSVTRIGDAAFYGCGSISRVRLYNSLQYIGDSAFGGCFSLNEVRSEIEDPFIISEYTFDFREEQTLYVPEGTKFLYENTDFWWLFPNIVVDEMLSVSPVSADEDSAGTKVYDLQGRRTDRPVKGNIYISNKKKVLF